MSESNEVFCPRCDGYLAEENIEIDGEFVCAECVDENELRKMVIRLQTNLRARDAFLARRRTGRDVMARSLQEITAHIRAVSGNPSIAHTLIQTEDLLALCDYAENNRQAMVDHMLSADRDKDQMVVARNIIMNTAIPPAADNEH